MLPYFSIFSYSVAYVFCLSSNWVVFVNTWQKGGEMVDMWESYLFCLGGVEIVFGRGRYYLSCFTLLIDLYLWVINDICLYCVLCEVKNLFLFYLYFPHMCLCVCWMFQETLGVSTGRVCAQPRLDPNEAGGWKIDPKQTQRSGQIFRFGFRRFCVDLGWSRVFWSVPKYGRI